MQRLCRTPLAETKPGFGPSSESAVPPWCVIESECDHSTSQQDLDGTLPLETGPQLSDPSLRCSVQSGIVGTILHVLQKHLRSPSFRDFLLELCRMTSQKVVVTPVTHMN